jgi:hypothetical protein
MERMGVRLVAAAAAVLCLAACLPCAASAAEGARTIATAPSVGFNAPVRGRMFDSAFFSGYSVAYWTMGLSKGQHITIRAAASGGAAPPCPLVFMPGTDDSNVSGTQPVLDPAYQQRNGSRNVQRFIASETGTYVLAMTNLDSYLSGPLQCLAAAPGLPFTFKVSTGKPGVRSHSSGGRKGVAASPASSHVVQPGQSLWMIAEGLLREPSVAQVAFEVGRLWQLNAERIGTGDPDLIYAGLRLRLK